LRALNDITPTCLRCNKRAEKRKLFLTHYTLAKGQHDVCLCETCFYLLPVDLAKKVKYASEGHAKSLEFNKKFISAFGETSRKNLDLNCYGVIFYDGTDWVHPRYETFKQEKEFAKGIKRALKEKEPIHELYNKGSLMTNEEVEALLKERINGIS